MSDKAHPTVSVIIPALNEEQALPHVLREIPRDRVAEVIVVDNGSTDRTAEVAASCGARVVREARRGYGAACLRGIAALPPNTDVVVFLDADHSDDPCDLPRLLAPIEEGRADLVIGSRTLGAREPGSLMPHQVAGNRLATFLVSLLFRKRYTDLGPFRAIRRDLLDLLEMKDLDFGWTIEMQVKAVRRGLRVLEVPVRYRRRIGVSKISGTVAGTARAGWTIIWTIVRLAIAPT